MLEHINSWMLRIKSGAEASAPVISVSPMTCLSPSTHCLSTSLKAQLNAYFSLWTSVITLVLNSHAGKHQCIDGCTFELSHPQWGCDSQTPTCINITWALLSLDGWAQPKSFRFSRSETGLRVCISNKFPGEVDAAVPGPYFKNLCSRESPLSFSACYILPLHPPGKSLLFVWSIYCFVTKSKSFVNVKSEYLKKIFNLYQSKSTHN